MARTISIEELPSEQQAKAREYQDEYGSGIVVAKKIKQGEYVNGPYSYFVALVNGERKWEYLGSYSGSFESTEETPENELYDVDEAFDHIEDSFGDFSYQFGSNAWNSMNMGEKFVISPTVPVGKPHNGSKQTIVSSLYISDEGDELVFEFDREGKNIFQDFTRSVDLSQSPEEVESDLEDAIYDLEKVVGDVVEREAERVEEEYGISLDERGKLEKWIVNVGKYETFDKYFKDQISRLPNLKSINNPSRGDYQDVLDVPRVGEKTAFKLARKGYVDEAREDAFNIKERLTEIEGVGEATAIGIVEHLQNQQNKSKNRSVNSFVSKVPNIPSHGVNSIASSYSSIDELRSDVGNLEELPGIGSKSVERIERFLELHDNEFEKQISDDDTVEAVKAFEQDIKDAGLVDEVDWNNKQLQSKPGNHTWKSDGDKIIKLKADHPDGGFGLNDGKESKEMVAAHELAHALESDDYNETGTTTKRKTGEFIKNMSEDAQTELEYYHGVFHQDSRKDPQERFVNLISGLVAEPERTREIAPNAVDELENLARQMDDDRRDILHALLDGAYHT